MSAYQKARFESFIVDAPLAVAAELAAEWIDSGEWKIENLEQSLNAFSNNPQWAPVKSRATMTGMVRERKPAR